MGAERFELPTDETLLWAIPADSVESQVTFASRSIGGARDDLSHAGSAQKMRAVLQVYVL